MKKLLMILMIGMFLISFVSALDNLPTAKLNQEYLIKQTCASCSNINISVSNVNGFVLNNVEMINNGSGVWVYNYTPIVELRHDVNGIGDISGVDTNFVTYFEVTGTGKESASGIVIVFFSIIFILIFFFGLLYFFISLERVMHFDMDLIDTIIMMGAYLSMWIFYYLSQEYLSNLVINNLLELAIDVGAVTHVFLPLVGFMVSFIMTQLKFKQKSRITY